MKSIGVGLIGSGFISDIHAQAFRQVRGARLVAVASATESRVRQFAEKFNIPNWSTDYRDLLSLSEVELVVLGIPNWLHCQCTVDAAQAGKHVICEKPLCMNLEEADRMIETCRRAGVKLMYAEELCFAPKYVRVKQLVEEGALGEVYLVKQSEKHSGPHSQWFWDVEQSGGGVLMDMGCHGIQFARWLLNNSRVKSVLAHCGTYVHRQITKGDDSATLILEFENNAFALIEGSWARPGGMDDRSEVYGSKGVTYADLLHGNALETFSEIGYGYAVEKAPTTKGWSFPVFEEIWNYGFPQELQHFVDCLRFDSTPLVTGEDGKAVLEIIFATYASAGSGQRIVLPFFSEAKRPIDLWLDASEQGDGVNRGRT